MAADYRRDQDLFFKWIDENYPEVIKVGPSTTGGDFNPDRSGGVENLVNAVCCKDLLEGTRVPLQVFSYHYYNGGSDRLAGIIPEVHWPAEEAHTDAYLDVAPAAARCYAALRDKYVPGGQMWVTESGDAGGGGDSWASTYLDVLRTLNELGEFSVITDGVIFHNTLASSDYGFLERVVFNPRPNYFAVLLWNRLMGTVVYDSGENGNMRASVMTLNGRPLVLGECDELPDLAPEIMPAGSMKIAPGGCAFIVL